MDEKQLEGIVKRNDPLPLTDSVYRIALRADQELDENGNLIPKLSCFSLSADDIKDHYRLSVDWDKMTTPEAVMVRVGTSFKKNTHQYKPWENRILYKLEVSFLKQLLFISDVIYTPSKTNDAHSSICFDNGRYNYQEHRPEILTEIRNHAKRFIVEVKIDEVKQKVDEVRKAGQEAHLP